jgi:hypothetical protein
MGIARKFLRVAVAVLGAAALSVLFFVLLGMLAPIWIMMAIYGRDAVQGAPAHGGAILFATVPITGLLSLIAFAGFTEMIYRKLPFGRTKDSPEGNRASDAPGS